jgi:putative salt-induced outer membrane protein YdiY
MILGATPLLLPAATELRLRNGDRLSGELLRRTEGRIIFHSPVLGEISVAESAAVVVEVPDTPVESLVGLPPVVSHSRPPLGSDKHEPLASGISRPSKERWRGKIEFGFQQQSGRRDTVDFSLRADAERAKGPNDFKAIGRMFYGRQDHQVSYERYDASARFRHEFTKRTFAQSLTSYATDYIKKIDMNIEQNIGAGYRVVQRARHVINVGAGGTLQARESDGAPTETTVLGEIFQDYTYRFNGHLSFLQDTDLLYSPKSVSNGRHDVSNYRFRFNSALQGKLTERVSLNLRYEYEFDNTVPDMAQKEDRRITSSIGYSL